MTLTLYYMDMSPGSRAILMLSEMLDLDLNCIYIDLTTGEQFSPEHLEKNPMHTVPVLEDDDLVLIDSHCILPYLVNAYATDDKLYPKDPKKRAMVDLMLHFDNTYLVAREKSAVIKLLTANETSITQENYDLISDSYNYLEIFLTKRKYIAGETLTIADLSCVTTATTLHEILPIDEEKYPHVVAWIDDMRTLPFFEKINEKGIKEFKEKIMSLLKN